VSFFNRLKAIVQAKANTALDAAEKPDEMLDLSYEKQTELLTRVRRGIADIATSKKRLELQADKLQQSITTLQGQAAQALQAGREDLARTALERKAGAQAQVQSLQAQRDQLQQEQDKLVASEQKLETRVEAFRVRKETLKAQYTAAEAQTKIGEAVSGISEEMGDVGLAIQRAEDKTANMQARAGAVDELLASGALDDVTSEPGGDIQAQLDALSAGSSVDAELAKMKAELGAGAPAPKEIGAAGEESK
jgi:phage shock protein A